MRQHQPAPRIGWVGPLAAAAAAWLLAAGPAQAHPMGNFAICHYTRLQAEHDGLHVRYILDLAEIPTVGEKQALDRDRDGIVSDRERAAYLSSKAPELLSGLTLVVNGERVPLRQASGAVQFLPGAGGLETMKILLDLRAPLSPLDEDRAVVFRDGNYAARAGWKEVIAVAGPGVALWDSSVPSRDRSRELSDYPPDAIPPQDTEARFTVVPGETAGPPDDPLAPTAEAGRSGTPRDAFTQAIGYSDLSPVWVLTGLVIAFGFGALHALSPGHGKAMVAAYLVGTRGTAWHAALLGIAVTVTHTLGVFALGLASLAASQYVVPERLYPILSAVSGLIISAVGTRLLYFRVRRLLRGPQRSSEARVASAHHSHMPEGPVTPRALIALGISGGIIPCPSALVVLLAAVALSRIAYGLLLISAFSLGLASVLVALGLLVVYARRWLDRFTVSAAILRRVPIASAGVITLIGIALVVRAFEQGLP